MNDYNLCKLNLIILVNLKHENEKSKFTWKHIKHFIVSINILSDHTCESQNKTIQILDDPHMILAFSFLTNTMHHTRGM